MYQVGRTQQVHTVVVPFACVGHTHVGGGHQILVLFLATQDEGIACATFDAGQFGGIEDFTTAQQHMEALTQVLLGAQRIVGNLLVGVHEAIEVSVAVIIGSQGDGIIHIGHRAIGKGYRGGQSSDLQCPTFRQSLY